MSDGYWVLMRRDGEYSDTWLTAVGLFSDRDAAQYEADRLNKEIEANNRRYVELMMSYMPDREEPLPWYRSDLINPRSKRDEYYKELERRDMSHHETEYFIQDERLPVNEIFPPQKFGKCES